MSGTAPVPGAAAGRAAAAGGTVAIGAAAAGVDSAAGSAALTLDAVKTQISGSLAHGRRHRRLVLCVLLAVMALLAVGMLCIGNTIYNPVYVWQALTGTAADPVPATAIRAIFDYRLPRLCAGVLVGFCFGVAGNSFQTMLRNPLASPDVIGITSGASTAAVFCILILGLGTLQTLWITMASALGLAAAIYGLSTVGGFSPGKLILVGLGMQAMATAVTSFLLLKGAEYDVPSALRWLSGSLNSVTMEHVLILLVTLPLALLALVVGRRLRIMELGQEMATTLGASPGVVRVVLIVTTVLMIALCTSVTGPVACVTFLSGPIATRIVGSRSYASVPAGLIGIILILAGDIIGQNFLPSRLAVGIITGLMGTPYLLYLLIRMNRKGEM